jgi:hypothetical protein
MEKEIFMEIPVRQRTVVMESEAEAVSVVN